MRRGPGIVVVAAVAVLGLTGCSTATEVPRARQSVSDVALSGCDTVKCTGTLEGAAYEILLPSSWNGTLLIYSHGYRSAQPTPPDFEPVSTAPEPAPGWSSGAKEVGQALLDQGYALAGSAYASNGWAVADGVAAAEQLHDFFVNNVADPYRTYVWGDSLGGLITQTVAEKHPEWVDGVAPFCGALAGIVPNLDLALDVAYATKELLYPRMRLTGFTSYEDAVRTWQQAVKRVVAAAEDTEGGGTAAILFIGMLVDAPSQTSMFDGSTLESSVKATVEGIATALGFGTFGRYDVEQRFGGNPSTNDGTDYAARISPAEAELIDAVTAGKAADLVATLQQGTRVGADAAARQRAQAEGGDPQGTVTAPTITLHTAADPLVIVQNESFFRHRYEQATSAGTATAGLVQLFTAAPPAYPQDPGAPYGAGHCNFTPQSRVAVIDLLDAWARDGVAPTPAAAAEAFGDDSGFAPDFRPGPWPDPRALEP